jgi:rifampicin phosphotransferase
LVSSFDESFSVTWHDPADAESIWAIDRIHFAQPVPPLGEDFFDVIVAASWRTRTTFANGYLFMKDFAPPPTPQEVLEQGAVNIWHGKYLPRVREICSRVRGRDYDSLTAAQIAALLPTIFDEAAEAFQYPTVVASQVMGPALALALFCERELGEDGPVLSATLLQGFANESAAAGAGLGELAEFAAGKPELAEALKAGRYDDVGSLPGGTEFLEKLHTFLDNYGWRADEWCLVHRPTWAEQPATPLMLIGRYLSDPRHSPALAHDRAVELRQTTAEAIEARLTDSNREQFQQMLAAAQAHVPISEERALWQLIAIGSVRVPLLALGRKLVDADVIENPDDVFYLRLAELQDVSSTPRSFEVEVGQRRETLERWQKLSPPDSIGRPLVIADRSPQSQVVHRYFFGTVAQPSDETLVRGSGASQGIARGRARVIHGLGEAGLLEQGEVLVCKTTAPPWTPLFAIAAAVVTDTGGILSHSAICAREYAIPCVVGTQVGTSTIPDGAMVTVDGTKGTVTIEASVL